MSFTQYIGGIHRFSDPGIFQPFDLAGLDADPDSQFVLSGHIFALDQTIGPGSLVVSGASLDLFESTTTAAVSNYPNIGGPGAEEINAVGVSTNAGSIGTFGVYYGTPVLPIEITDVFSRNGAVVLPGTLINTGDIYIDGRTSEGLTINGSDDAELINNGSLAGGGPLDVNVPVLGTGNIGVDPIPFNTPYTTFSKAVSAGQTVDIPTGILHPTDPIDFRATISDFTSLGGEIKLDQQATSALFTGHVLTLFSGTSVIGELKFTDEITADSLLITVSTDGTVIDPNNEYLGDFRPVPTPNLTISTTGTTPVLPPISLPGRPANLPTRGPDLTFTSGAHAASIDLLSGYTVRLEGTDAAAAPSLGETSVTFGSSFALRVEGQGAAARFGSLAAVGYNENDGTIAATSGSGGGAGSLAFDISDVTSPDGVTILAGAFNNKATIDAEAGSTITVTGTSDSKLINAGTVTANGMVFIDPTITGAGTMTVGQAAGAAGSLEFGQNQVATGQSILLNAGTLTIGDAPGFHATIFDFNPHDQVVLKGVDVTVVTYNNGALLLDGGAAGTLHFHRPNGVTFDTNSFQLSHSGGNTTITTPV